MAAVADWRVHRVSPSLRDLGIGPTFREARRGSVSDLSFPKQPLWRDLAYLIESCSRFLRLSHFISRVCVLPGEKLCVSLSVAS